MRRADGRAISLKEFPLRSAETVLAEKIVLEVPDGRSITTLVNATPIRSEAGSVEPVVVTLQDLAPLQELESLRAGFLGMVSHELRARLTSIKGSTNIVLGASPAPDPAETLQLFRIIAEQADRMRVLINDLLDAGRIDLPPDLPRVMADRWRIIQVLNNLFSSASRHSPELSPLRVAAVRDGV